METQLPTTTCCNMNAYVLKFTMQYKLMNENEITYLHNLLSSHSFPQIKWFIFCVWISSIDFFLLINLLLFCAAPSMIIGTLCKDL